MSIEEAKKQVIKNKKYGRILGDCKRSNKSVKYTLKEKGRKSRVINENIRIIIKSRFITVSLGNNNFINISTKTSIK